MLITFIRHSKTKFNKDISSLLWQLADEGIALAEELSNRSEIKDIDVLYTSQQTKALQTTLILAKDNHIPIKTEPELTELTSITNGYIEDYEGEILKLFSGKIDRINKGESIEEGKKRINNTLKDIINKEKHCKNIGIVSHCMILSIFASQYIEKNWYEIHQRMQMPDLAIFDWDNKKFLKFFKL